MALSGVHVVCGLAGGTGFGGVPQPLLGDVLWSETLAAAGVTSKVAPEQVGSAGRAIFHVRSAIDVWVAVGPSPDATAGPRLYVPANTDYDFFVNAGSKLAWIAA